MLLYRLGGGVPIQSWMGGVPHAVLARPGGYQSSSGQGGTPSSLGQGVPHPVLARKGTLGYPPIQTLDGVPPVETWDGVPFPIQTWYGVLPSARLGMGYPMVQTWDGVPPSWSGMMGYPSSQLYGVPPHPDLGWGTPLSAGWGTPPKVEQTHTGENITSRCTTYAVEWVQNKM